MPAAPANMVEVEELDEVQTPHNGPGRVSRGNLAPPTRHILPLQRWCPETQATQAQQGHPTITAGVQVAQVRGNKRAPQGASTEK